MTHPIDEGLRAGVFDNLPLPTVVLDGDAFCYIDCNAAAVQMLGFPSREEMLSLVPLDMSTSSQPDGRSSGEKYRDNLRKAEEEGATVFEWRLRRPDGTIWFASVHLIFFMIDGRRLFQFTLVDITEQKKSERIRLALHDLMIGLNSCDDFKRGLGTILETLLNFEPIDCGGIHLVDSLDESLNLAVHRGLSESFVSVIARVPRDAVNVRIAFEGKMRYGAYNEIFEPVDAVRANEGLRACALIPVMAQGKLIALMDLASHTSDSIPGDVRQAIELIALQVGGSIFRLRTEEDLRESNSLLSRFIEKSPIYAYIKSVTAGESRVIYASEKFSELVGIAGPDMIGKTMKDLFPSEFAEKITEDDRMVISKGEVLSIEEELNGRTYSTIKFPIRQETRYLLAGYTIDITDLKKTEEALRRNELRLRALMNNIPSSIIQYGTDLTIMFINRAVTGRDADPEIYKGRRLTEFGISPTDAAEVESDILKVIETGHPTQNVYRIRASGGERDYDTVIVPEFDDSGKVQSVITISQDITDRRHAEESLRRSETLFQTLFMAVPEGIYLSEPMFDDEGKPYDYRYVEVNPKFEQIIGMSRDMIIGKTFREIMPSYTTGWLENYFRVAATGEASSYYFYSQEYDRHFETYSYKTSSEQIAVFVRDVTERKRTESALQNMQKLESLSMLAGGIAHDFNNLLGGVYGYIDIAIERNRESAVAECLLRASETIDRARDLTGQLLTFAKGGAPVKKTDSFNPFISETVRFALSGSNCSCKFTIPDDLWPGYFDRNQIGQVIGNIVINAHQSMPHGGGIEISAANVDLSESAHAILLPGRYVRISIRDHDGGIPREILSRIFDPFFTTKPKSHGIGLAASYSIVSRHGGTIDVESEPGKGAVFHVYIPASKDKAPSPDAGSSSVHMGKGTILVMDDEAALRKVIKAMLESFGYSVICASNGDEAFSAFREDRASKCGITGMIVDLTIPGGMGGKELIEKVRNVDREIPVIVASGYADDPIMAAPKLFGFTASICKPFRKAELAELLGTHVARE